MLAYTALIVVGFGALAALAGGQIARGSMEDFAQSLSVQADLLARTLHEDIEHMLEGENSREQLDARASSLATQTGVRLLLLDMRGLVWFDSTGDMNGADLDAAPEVAAARQGRSATHVRADEAGIETLYAAAPVIDDDRVVAVVLLAQPTTATSSLVRQRWLTLGSGVVLLGLLALGASGWLAASLTRPLQELRTAALRLAAGDFSLRLPETRRDELGQVAIAFNHMAAQVLTMLDEQRAFAANASHELRTPLTTIRLRSEALRYDDLDSDTTHQYIAEIDDEVARLGNLVEDLISLSRFDAGRAERGDELVDVVRLARAVIHDLAQREGAQGRELILEASSDLPELRASTQHIRVVLRNLLGNAVSYTPAGGKIVCQIEKLPDALQFIFADTGQGVAPDDLPRLFERFYRADKARSRGGVGLGLPLVQSIVHFYGGRIEIASSGLEQGTTVRVWWPLPASSQS
jgi:signal transduction histidine kinase